MRHSEFPAIRDEIALASMLTRLEALLVLRDVYRNEYEGFRRMLRTATDHNEIDGLNYELYDKENGVAWRLAKADAGVEDIYRDSRYIEWFKSKEKVA